MGWSPLTSPRAVTRSCSRSAPISRRRVSIAPPTRACERKASSARSWLKRPRVTRCSSSRSVIAPLAILRRGGSAGTDDERLGQLVVEGLTPPVEEGEPESGEERDEGDDGEGGSGDGPTRGRCESGLVDQPDAEEPAPGCPAIPEEREGARVDETEHQCECHARGEHGVQLVDAGHDPVDAGELGGGGSVRGDERCGETDVEGEDPADERAIDDEGRDALPQGGGSGPDLDDAAEGRPGRLVRDGAGD